MMQKLIKVGNSYAVTIPKRFVDSLDTPEEAIVSMHVQPAEGKIVLDFREEEMVDKIVDPEVYKVAKKLLKQYLPAFKELAKK